MDLMVDDGTRGRCGLPQTYHTPNSVRRKGRLRNCPGALFALLNAPLDSLVALCSNNKQ